jgi:hypothetical protein
MGFVTFSEQRAIISLSSITVDLFNGESLCFLWGSNWIFKYYLDEVRVSKREAFYKFTQHPTRSHQNSKAWPVDMMKMVRICKVCNKWVLGRLRPQTILSRTPPWRQQSSSSCYRAAHASTSYALPSTAQATLSSPCVPNILVVSGWWREKRSETRRFPGPVGQRRI